MNRAKVLETGISDDTANRTLYTLSALRLRGNNREEVFEVVVDKSWENYMKTKILKFTNQTANRIMRLHHQ